MEAFAMSYDDQSKCRKLGEFSKNTTIGENNMEQQNSMESGQTTQNVNSKSPEKKFSAGLVTATVWANSTMVNNEPRVIRNVNLEKRFKDKDGNWQSSNSLNINDIPRANLVLSEAFKYITLKDNSSNN